MVGVGRRNISTEIAHPNFYERFTISFSEEKFHYRTAHKSRKIGLDFVSVRSRVGFVKASLHTIDITGTEPTRRRRLIDGERHQSQT